ncbi:hypothetical protein SAMN05421737_1153 [Shouchella lonarensis]|uniref:Uncharacterized protein n=1 Tax=Shouchella lonarensis TaxID=1464122 RepID=A0A1G6P5U2_9BACI|nr:hypothetical protein SAMN05421737_1153 [Shouchella lonarensis]
MLTFMIGMIFPAILITLLLFILLHFIYKKASSLVKHLFLNAMIPAIIVASYLLFLYDFTKIGMLFFAYLPVAFLCFVIFGSIPQILCVRLQSSRVQRGFIYMMTGAVGFLCLLLIFREGRSLVDTIDVNIIILYVLSWGTFFFMDVWLDRMGDSDK